MKKLYTLSLILLSAVTFGQANRIALFEEFTGENCGPCASTNPTLDALIKANPTKALMLKYQVPIPSAGPIYLAYTADSDARRSYYGVNSAPNGRLDGSTFGSGQTHPASLTQAMIDNAAAISSSFSMTTTHTLSADLDSIFISVTVTNVDGFTVNSMSAGSLRLHVSVIEEEIQFAVSPGTNGETDYYHINREMFPDAAGTQMADSWAVNQTQTFTFAEELTQRIYNYNEVGVVAFIQDNGDQSVLQSSSSAAVPAPTNIPDMTITNQIAGGGDLCAGTVVPEFEIENLSSATCTSADVRYRINGGAWVTQAWTGSIGMNGTATVTFPSTNLPFATNNIEAQVINPNGSRDVNALNNEITPITLNVLSPIVSPAPFEANFENATAGDVPSNMILNGNTTFNTVINRAFVNGSYDMGAYGESNNSMLFGFFYLQNGEIGELILPKVDASAVSGARVYFAHAHQSYSGENDALEVLASDDCGQTWTSIWAQSGSDLITTSTPNNTNPFFPDAPDWTWNVAFLPGNYQNSSELILKFVGTSDYGNNLFIDNVWVSNTALGIEDENAFDEAVLFPNPANRHAEIRFDVVEAGTVTVSVMDMNGRQMSTQSLEASAGAHAMDLDVAELPAGVYMVQISQNDNVNTLRLNVTH